MKTLYKISILVLFLISYTSFSQTSEQQKMIDKALKMRDSIMNTPEMKAIMQQTNEIEKESKKKTKTKPIPEAVKNEDKYWKNTLASDNNTILKNWNSGEADLVFNYLYDSRKDKVEIIKVGFIKADGTIELNPTKEVPVLQALNNFKNGNNFFDIHDTNAYKYTNEKTGFKLNSYLLVYQNGRKIGTLTVGNSVKVTQNLLTLGDLYYGDEGYLLSWVYVDEACAIKANENWKGDLSNTGTPLIVETNVTYNLSFKQGWNLVKTEVVGEYKFVDVPEEDRSRYKKHEHTVIPSIPNDATYFFRSVVHY